MVRVGEFAWTALEPQEGNYDLTGWNVPSILPASTAFMSFSARRPPGPPVWMATKYPDILRHGYRRQAIYRCNTQSL